MHARVWTYRSATVAVAGLLLALSAVTIWLLLHARGAEIANVLSLPVAVAGVAVALYGIRLRPNATDSSVLNTAARCLAGQVAEQEAAVQQRLLADTGDVRAANVGFAQPVGDLVRWRTDGGDREGTLESVASFYENLTRGRLVVLGEAGAGKTVLAIQILLDLVRASLASESHEKRHAVGRIPVRLSLPAFSTANSVSPTELRRSLDGWIADHLVKAYGQKKPVARQLVDQGLILPILDGLDEMDGEGDEPVRARRVIRALNHFVGPSLRPVVLTCRSDRYWQLSKKTISTGLLDVVQDATVVVVQPLTTEEVIGWLACQFPDPTSPEGVERRWQPVIRRMRERPAGALARSLASPLRLYLAINAYRDPGGNPRELLGIRSSEIDRYLFGSLIPAVTARLPNSRGAHYDAGDVGRWLTTLARHMGEMGKQGRSGVDLNPLDLWRSTGGLRGLGAPVLPGKGGRNVLIATAIAHSSLTVCLLLLFYFLRSSVVGQSPVWLTSTNVFFVVGIVALVSIASLREDPDPRRLDLARIHTETGRRHILYGFHLWFSIAIIVGIASHSMGVIAGSLGLVEAIIIGPIVGATIGAPMALLFGSVMGLQSQRIMIDRPSKLATSLLAFDAAVVIVVGLSIGWSFGLYFLSVEIFAVFTVAGLAIGFALRSASPLPRYVLALAVLIRTGSAPRRFGEFLDWAHNAGLLRLSGIAVQFRHRQLQHRLADASSEQ